MLDRGYIDDDVDYMSDDGSMGYVLKIDVDIGR